MERPIPYEGDKNYIFISYAHKDSDRVWPVIERMQKDGFRVWYDDGISPGSEWDENIARHVKECSFFIAFMSENYLASDNCKDELNYSRDLDKQQLIIYLDPVELPPALAMRIGRNQAIMKYGMNDDEFYGKLYDAQGIEYQHKDNTAPKITLERPQEVHTKEPRKNKMLLPLLAGALAVTVAGAGLMWFGGRDNTVSDSTQAGIAGTVSTDSGELNQITNVEVFDDKNLNIKALGSKMDSRYMTFMFSCENKGRADAFLSSSSTYINGFDIDPDWTGTLPAGKISLIEMVVPLETFERYGIDPNNITIFETALDGRFLDDSANIYTDVFAYYPYGEENAVLNGYEVREGDTVLLDNEEALIVTRDSSEYTGEGYRFQEIIFFNRNSETRALKLENETVNGYLLDSHHGTTALGGHTSAVDILYYADDVAQTEYSQLLEYSGEFFICPGHMSYKEGDKTYPFTIYPEGEEAAKALKPRELKNDELVYEDENLRIGYLGAAEYFNEGYADVFYIYNHSNQKRYMDITFRWDDDYGYYLDLPSLEPGQQLLFFSKRIESFYGKDATGYLDVRSTENKQFTDEDMYQTVSFKLRDPE